jgi:hypothetical protein
MQVVARVQYNLTRPCTRAPACSGKNQERNGGPGGWFLMPDHVGEPPSGQVRRRRHTAYKFILRFLA